MGIDPGPAETNVALDTEVRVDFSEAVIEGDYSLDVAGAAGAATLAADGLSASWIGSAALDAETEYTINASVCADSQSSVFTTSAAVDLAALVGKTFAVPWADMSFTEPGNAGEIINLLGDIDEILLQMNAIDATTFEVDSAASFTGDDGNGNIVISCGSVVQETGDFSQNPFFSFGPQDVDFPLGGGVSTLVEDLELRAQFDGSGTFATNIQLSGLIAVEDLLPGADCNSAVVSLFQPTCLPCNASQVPPYECMLIEANAPQADVSTFDIFADCDLGTTTGSTGGGTDTGVP